MSNAKSLRSLTIVGNLITFTIIVAILYLLNGVLIPVVLAGVLTFILCPLVMYLQRWGLGRVSAVVATMVLTSFVIGGLIALVGLQVNSLANDLPKYQQNIRKKVTELRAGTKGGALDRIRAAVQDVVQEQPPEIVPGMQASETVSAHIVADEGLLSKILAPLRALNPILEPMAKGLLALILTIFMLIRREDLRNRMISFAMEGSLTTTTKALDEAGRKISRYMILQLITNGIFGLLIGVGLYFIGIPYALLWGLCAAILRYVPYIGAWMAAAPPLAISFVTVPGWTAMVIVFILFLFLELITGNVLEPRLYGKGIGVSEVALLVCAAFWAWVWGPVGLILATPLTVCLVVAGKYVPPLAFFNRLLGDSPALKPYVVYLQRLLARDEIEAAAIVQTYLAQNAPESVYDNLFLPALALARQDRISGVMTAEDERFVLYQTTVIMKNLLSLSTEPELRSTNIRPQSLFANIARLLDNDSSQTRSAISDRKTEDTGRKQYPAVRLFGLPAHHEVDELTLQMLNQLVLPSGIQVEILSTKMVPSEIIAQVSMQKPKLVFVAALPPGGMPQACYFCESLRAVSPNMGIVVGCWGMESNLDELISKLQAAGANYVTTTLLGGRSHIWEMLRSSTSPSELESGSLEVIGEAAQ
jgi:predicted PurR-regulated permease PerM